MKAMDLGDGADGSPIVLQDGERLTHMHVIGASGSGKSKFLEHMMRQDIAHRQGFCLIDPHGTLYTEVLNHCAHKVHNNDIVLLDLSKPDHIIGFNPFRKAPNGDVSAQVECRIKAIMHAWGVENADETPTLERILRLVFTTLLDLNLPFHAAQYLIDFNSGEFRSSLIQQIASPLIRREWEELEKLKASDWRSEFLSTKNRLFRLLASDTLTRFFNSTSIDLAEIIDQGKILLVNLGRSDELSDGSTRVFGSLLVNEFFEVALRRRDVPGKPLKPYYLYMDEFQNFVGMDIASMLDQVRKYRLFTVLAHQRFGQLDDDLRDAVLTNCGIKAVFGGLEFNTARMMAQEMFVGQLDPMRIKVAIYQTKFWPEYGRDKVYTRSRSSGRSIGRGENSTSGDSSASAHGQFFQPCDWFANPLSSTSITAVSGTSAASGSHWNETDFDGAADGVADVPILIPVPFKELSSLQYFTPEEQLLEMTGALKRQFERHCFIKIQYQDTQPLRVPFIKTGTTPSEARMRYIQKKLLAEGARTKADVDEAIAKEDAALRRTISNKSAKKDKANSEDPPPWSELLGRE